MRIEVTVREPDGTEHDVALVAPPATPLGEVLAALHRTFPGIPVGRLGEHRLDAAAAFESSPVERGAVLGSDPPASGDGFLLRLEVIGGPSAGLSVALANGDTTIGRATGRDLVLADPLVSRRHATVTTTRESMTVRDLASTGGTFVNGTRINGAAPLAATDTVRIGDSHLAVRTPTAGHPDEPTRPEERVVDWPADPQVDVRRGQLTAALIPAAAGVVLAAVLRSIEFLAFALLSPLALAATGLIERRRSRRTGRGAHHTVEAQRAALERDIATRLDAERGYRRAHHPDPLSVLRTARAPQTRRTRSAPLVVRTGLGTVPSRLKVRIGDAVAPAAQLPDVPVTVDFATGPWAIVGPRTVREASARWLVGQLAVQSPPEDLEIAVLAATVARWRWLRWLPHVRGRIAYTPAELATVAGDITAEIAHRSAATTPSTCRLVVVVADADATLRLAPVLADASDHGVSGLFLADGDPIAVPRDRVIRIGGDSGTRARIGDGPVSILDQVGTAWAEQLARALAPGRGHRPSGSLPTQCRLVDLAGLEPPTAPAIATRWRRSDGGLRACIGTAEDQTVELDLVRDGPHGLIAGTTGSGKSELLQSLLASLAANHSPDELNLLLVDYKGGAALAPFADLPHTVGLVTDLDDYLGRRVLTALRSELRHRERLLAGVGATDLGSYRAKDRSLPRLLIVVDELAALTESFGGLVPGLVEIAQRGRSLGVHLLLATQRPSGVVSADIRANISLCLALRTTSAAESVDVIDDPAAAAISAATPGRAYLRTGARLRALQCGCVSTPAPDAAVRVELLDDRLRTRGSDAAPGETDLGRIVIAVRAAAKGRPKPRRPWLPPLPAHVAVAGLPQPDAPAELAIGMADLPAEQRRAAAAVDCDAGSVVFTGGPRSGRTSALVSLALAAAERFGPDELEIHAAGAAAFTAGIRALPHVGTVAGYSDGGRLAARLAERLSADAFGAGGVRISARCLLLVDDWEVLADSSEQLDGGRTVERILALARDGPAAGITVAIAGGRATLSTRVTAGAPTRFVLRLTERGDYPAAGVDVSDVPRTMPAGRAVRVGDGVEVQLCDPNEHEARAAACRRRCPDPQRRTVLRPLPRTVHLHELPRDGRWLLGVGGDAASPIGVDPHVRGGRLLVAGPPGSGRSTVLRVLLAQSDPAAIWVAAPQDSPVAAAAAGRDVPLLLPTRLPDALPPPHCVLLVDDAERFTDTAIGDALLEWVRAAEPGGAVVVAARSDTVALTTRGLGAELRGARCGVLLQPGPLDAELLGVRLPRLLSSDIPGRGVLVPHPAWQLGRDPIPLQVALT